MPAKSLAELASTVCIKNIRALDSVGDYLPYESVRQILSKIESAYQLRQIELNSPQLLGETVELWIKLIEKDFPLEYRAKAYKPQTPDKWHRVWEKYKKEHDTALEESENKLKNALAGLQEDKQKKTSKIVERKYLPRAGRSGPRRILGQRDASSSASSSTLSFNAGSRTKTHNGASVMRKVRREVKEIATIHGALSRPIRAPTLAAAGVSKAPAAMVSHHQRAALPSYRTSVKAAEPVSAVQQYEKRATFISDSEEDYDSLSGEEAAAKHAAPQSVPKPAPKPAATPVKKPYSEAAKVSLLKRKPAVLRTAPPAKRGTTTKQTAKPPVATIPHKQNSPGPASSKAAGAGATATATIKRAATPTSSPEKSVANSPGAEEPAAKRATPDTSTSALPNRPDRSESSATKTSPPPPLALRNGAAGPASPPEEVTAAAPPPPQRKRKAVDIFMRPKKRTG